MKTDPNEPINPTTEKNWHNENMRSIGLTKREHLAGLALQGLVSNGVISGFVKQNARLAIEAADALIVELNRDEKINPNVRVIVGTSTECIEKVSDVLQIKGAQQYQVIIEALK